MSDEPGFGTTEESCTLASSEPNTDGRELSAPRPLRTDARLPAEMSLMRLKMNSIFSSGILI